MINACLSKCYNFQSSFLILDKNFILRQFLHSCSLYFIKVELNTPLWGTWGLISLCKHCPEAQNCQDLTKWKFVMNDKPSCLAWRFRKKLTYSKKSHVHLRHLEKIDIQKGAVFQHSRFWNCDQSAWTVLVFIHWKNKTKFGEW